ncbi:hypothetical protein Poli38472_012241 [Pythium oligandrum]|uniref:Aspartyl/asparaginy/proline hydroxylase domain-containing protein n=1 Tax=Pythium oligandrum TaxID=41045 RepID=A0A8K1FKH6_PYTOL|nr:hypothetical protein Poli38472_012241 [Pythium oligandrum]|eukprot:TMW67125.1 hypothetical protein Poli38472_012241 [Pythium oligandrum]
MAPSSERQPAPDAPRRAYIPLSHKRVPTEMRSPHDHAHLLYAALVDEVDITDLRAHLLALPEDHWHEAYNRTHNVYFQRPFHDKLGVGNIMCLFSDTQLENVYELPLYATYKQWLEPIFATMHVHPDQVVRCLFARMPGETLIPPHHDNGPWVSKTHRMHVPILTYADVEFKSGGLVDSMTRYAFNEGTIVELNNAAKHSVWNPSKRHRIHLIFDYVEAAQQKRIKRTTLSAGQLCRQVRGRVEFVDVVDQKAQEQAQRAAGRLHSEMEALVTKHISAEAASTIATACRHHFIEQIDAKMFVRTVNRVLRGLDEQVVERIWSILVEMFGLVDALSKDELLAARQELVFAPNWVIIGAQKCGTTSLYDYLSQHPMAAKGKRREPHFFDWRWDAALEHKLSEADGATYKAILAEYAAARKDSASEEAVVKELRGNSLDGMRAKYLSSLQCEEPALAIRPPKQIGESTPSYLLYGERVARRMRMLYPNMKLIVMLRDPVKRAYSHFQMTADPNGTPSQLKMREPVRGKSFEQLVEEDLALLKAASVSSAPLESVESAAADCFQSYADGLSQQHGAHSYVGRGLYALQLALWLRVFPRDQILIIDLDDMKTREGTLREANKAFEFVGLEPYEVEDAERKNTRAYEPIDPVIQQRLREFYAPFNEQLFELIGQRFHWV